MKVKLTFSKTNKEMSKANPRFHNACEKAGVEPTKRQASKWRNGKGLAFIYRLGKSERFIKEAKEFKSAPEGTYFPKWMKPLAMNRLFSSETWDSAIKKGSRKKAINTEGV